MKVKGKERCRILKELRQQIAQSNDIELVIEECRHQGECAGTCPRCEAEVRYLEQELAKRQKLGRAVVIAGLAATVTFSAAGCDSIFGMRGEMPIAPVSTTVRASDEQPTPTAPEQSADPTELVTSEIAGGLPVVMPDGE